MELGESTRAVPRETLEEACARSKSATCSRGRCRGRGQVHLFYTAKLKGDFSLGTESLEVAMFSEDEIPWDDIAFHSGKFALKKYFEDQGKNNGVHIHELRRSNS